MTEKSGWAEINDTSLFYADRGGGGVTLVLLHELGGTADSWASVASALPGQYRIVRMDFRGAGRSQKVRSALKLDMMADDVAAVVRHLGVAGPIVVAGCALGSAVAVRYATRHPGSVIGMAGFNLVKGTAAERIPSVLARADQIAREGMRPLADEQLPKWCPPDLWVSQEAAIAHRGRFLANDPDSFAWTYRMLTELAVEADFARVGCPALVVAGARDPGTSPQATSAMADMFARRRFEVVESGHFMAVQSPGPVAKLLAEFVPWCQRGGEP